MALMGTVCGSPTCPAECELVHKDKHPIHHSHFQHISKLNDSSVAPWSLMYDVTEGREPERIQQARCTHCTVEHMIAEPIVIQISVYQRIRNNTRDAWDPELQPLQS
eukprot:superscaffoldBa00002170_g13423